MYVPLYHDPELYERKEISVPLSLTSDTIGIKCLNVNHLEEGVYYSLNGMKFENPSKVYN